MGGPTPQAGVVDAHRDFWFLRADDDPCFSDFFWAGAACRDRQPRRFQREAPVTSPVLHVLSWDAHWQSQGSGVGTSGDVAVFRRRAPSSGSLSRDPCPLNIWSVLRKMAGLSVCAYSFKSCLIFRSHTALGG